MSDRHWYKGDPDAYVEAEQEVSDLIAAGGVPDGSTGTNTEPGEIAPPAASTPDELAELIASIPLEGQVAILLGMLERVADQRDALQARIDAYEGHLERWEEMNRLIAASSLGGEEAQRIRDSVPPEVAKALVVAIRERARAEEAEARVADLELQAGDRERHLRDALKDMRAERDRLRTVVDAAISAVTLHRAWRDAAADDLTPLLRARAVALNALASAVDQLDGSPTMGEWHCRCGEQYARDLTACPACGTERS